MNEHNLKRLEYGMRLRESTDFIKGRAIVEFDNGTNWAMDTCIYSTRKNKF